VFDALEAIRVAIEAYAEEEDGKREAALSGFWLSAG
jgi:hypothetical protein